jgi:hypothetical protein
VVLASYRRAELFPKKFISAACNPQSTHFLDRPDSLPTFHAHHTLVIINLGEMAEAININTDGYGLHSPQSWLGNNSDNRFF